MKDCPKCKESSCFECGCCDCEHPTWLPYPENKPSDKIGWYLTTYVTTHMDKTFPPSALSSRWDGEQWNVGDIHNVTAFMPLPEPYEGKTNE